MKSQIRKHFPIRKSSLPEPAVWADWQKLCHKLYQTSLTQQDITQLRDFAHKVNIQTPPNAPPRQLCWHLAQSMTDFLKISDPVEINKIQKHLAPAYNPYVIEREYLRKHLYNNIIQWANEVLRKYMKKKDVYHLVLRYLFNKVIVRTSEDDPVFIATRSPLAENQLRKDFQYAKIPFKPDSFIQDLENQLSAAAHEVKKTPLNKDLKPYLDFKNYIHYGNDKYYDINRLGQKNKSKLNYLVALNLRYTYLQLSTHGLANMYEKYYPRNAGTEAFASVFNHYFDIFCTAFPDLEAPFGSMGSFFEVKQWTTPLIFVNPPFDESLINEVGLKVIHDLKVASQSHKFILTLPHWKDMPILKQLLQSPWLVESKTYKKEELPFIDHMSGKIIYPTAIIEIVLSNEQHLKNLQEVHHLRSAPHH